VRVWARQDGRARDRARREDMGGDREREKETCRPRSEEVQVQSSATATHHLYGPSLSFASFSPGLRESTTLG
jgi:hypothetical protein